MPVSTSFDANGALISLSAASAGVTSSNQPNMTHRGLKVWINISAITGTSPTLTVTIQGVDPVTKNAVTILASAALNSTGETVLTVYPGLTNVANSFQSDVLPPTWNVKTAIGGTTPAVTATIGFSKLA